MQGASFLGPLEVIWERIEKQGLARTAAGTYFHTSWSGARIRVSQGDANREKHFIKNSRPLRSIRGGPSSGGTSQARGEAQAGGATIRSPGDAAGVPRPASNARGITRQAVANGYVCRLRPRP